VTPSTTTTSIAPDPLPAGNVTVLVIGSDSRSRTALDGRSDVITVVQLTADRQHVNLVSIARDSYVSLPGGHSGKINEAYATGGAASLAEVVSEVLGLKLTYVLETGFESFIAISEALGGFTVQNRFRSSSSKVLFPQGPITLQGEVALTYVRERKGLPNGDLDRTERHRAALTAMLARLSQLAQREEGSVTRLVPELYRLVRATGLTLNQAVGLVPLVRKLTRSDVTSVMVPIASFDTIDGASVDIINRTQTAKLMAALKTGDLSAYVKAYGTSNAPTG
jgi:LCP family protein required for cell wall assembly